MRNGWRYQVSLLIFLMASVQMLAQNSNNRWEVQVNKQAFKWGDTIQIHVQQLNAQKNSAAQTLQIWLQHTETMQLVNFGIHF